MQDRIKYHLNKIENILSESEEDTFEEFNTESSAADRLRDLLDHLSQVKQELDNLTKDMEDIWEEFDSAS